MSYAGSTSSYSRTSAVIGSVAGATCLPEISSRPPLIAYSNVLARFTRAPKNCMSFPTRIPETQQAIAVSSSSAVRSRSSDSYWIAEVSSDTCAQNRLNPSGSAADQSTVRFGSGAGPRLYSVCRNRKLVLGHQRPAVRR